MSPVRLVFAAQIPGDIFRINSDGTDLENLTDSPADDFAPVWSPDGKYIAFISNRDGPQHGIYTMDGHGQQLTHLTAHLDTSQLHDFGQLAWSPNGRYLAFAATSNSSLERKLYLADTDLIDISDLDIRLARWIPNVFPDIIKAYYDKRDPLQVDWRGSEYRPIERSIAWSPDGRHLAYVSEDWEIYVVNLDNNERRNISQHADLDFHPAWSPDGNYVAFVSGRDRIKQVSAVGNGIQWINYEIYLSSAEGDHLSNITQSPLLESYPVWNHDGSAIAHEFITERWIAGEAGSFSVYYSSYPDRDWDYAPSSCIGLLPVSYPDEFDSGPIRQGQTPLKKEPTRAVGECDGEGFGEPEYRHSRFPSFNNDGSLIVYVQQTHTTSTQCPQTSSDRSKIPTDILVQAVDAELLVNPASSTRLENTCSTGPPAVAPIRPLNTSVVEETTFLPSHNALYPNAPNPFNSQTQIIFELSSAFEVELIVFDVLGQKVASLAHGSFAAGRHPVPFDGKGLSSGVYFYQLRAGAETHTRRMMLLK